MKLILIDVDDTLYPKGTGPFQQVTRRIDDYVMSFVGLSIAQTKELRKRYIEEYGSTLGGLMKHHGVDPGHYLDYVHDVPVEDMLKPDEKLKNALSGIRHDMVVFSNGSVDYVRRVLSSLDISGLFNDLFTIEYMDYIPKPRTYPYRKVLTLYGREPKDCVLVDDRLQNIATAIDMGMDTIQVGTEHPVKGSLKIPDIYAISQVIY